jgi:glycosyltransferase involved in cell wall biosynthesis
VNLAFSYLPAIVRLAFAVAREPADVVHVNGPYLLPLGLMHKRRYRSILVAEMDERPGSAQHSRSVSLLFRPFESRMMRIAARRVDLVITVTDPHRALLERDFEFPRHAVVRNAPELGMRGAFVLPPSVTADDPVVFATASSIFEGRCFEMLIEACALLTEQGAKIKIRVAGYGRPAYVRSLEALVLDLGVAAMIEFTGPVAMDHVHTVYADAHVGLSLYEPRFRHNDSLPNKVLECVSIGRPVLATGQPDVVAFLESTETGWLASSSPAGIARAMATIESDLRKGAIALPAMAARCRALGDTEINWEREFEPVMAFVGLADAQGPPPI